MMLNELAEDIHHMVRILERRGPGPVDRRRLALRVTLEEYEEVQRDMERIRVQLDFRHYPAKPDAVFILGVKIIPDFESPHG